MSKIVIVGGRKNTGQLVLDALKIKRKIVHLDGLNHNRLRALSDYHCPTVIIITDVVSHRGAKIARKNCKDVHLCLAANLIQLLKTITN